MRCVEISSFGAPDVLRLVERPDPLPGPGEVLIDVYAAGVNRPDVIQRLGKYSPPPGASDLPGLEVAGVVSAIGPDVSRWKPGDAVCALLSGGGYAERCTAPAEQCLPISAGMSMVQAAAIPETFFTVWANVFERGRLKEGEWILIHGGSSGIGTTAIQLASAFGAHVMTTAGTPEKCDACRRLGAAFAWDYRTTDWVAAVGDATGGHGANVVLDMVGGDYTSRNIAALAFEGRLVQIAFLKGPRVEIDFSVVMRRRLWLTGSLLRPRTPAEKGEIAAALEARVWPLLEKRRVAPVIDSVFPLARAADAHRHMEAGAHIGKIVLEVRT
jgi:NADPH2:quinone reductase